MPDNINPHPQKFEQHEPKQVHVDTLLENLLREVRESYKPLPHKKPDEHSKDVPHPAPHPGPHEPASGVIEGAAAGAAAGAAGSVGKDGGKNPIHRIDGPGPSYPDLPWIIFQTSHDAVGKKK